MDKFFQDWFVNHLKHVAQEICNFETIVFYLVVTGGHNNTQAFRGLGLVQNSNENSHSEWDLKFLQKIIT